MGTESSSFKSRFPSSLSLEFNLLPGQISYFFPLLQKGFAVEARVGISIQAFLCGHFGLSTEYLRGRVKTVFLDGKSVDDLDQAFVQDGSRLALSAALPGLAGAVLRRGSTYAKLRSQVAEKKKDLPGKPEEGLVILKLFNLLLPEIGGVFLQKGVLIPREDFLEFWGQHAEETRRGWGKARVNGEESEIDSLANLLQADLSPWIRLEVLEKN